MTYDVGGRDGGTRVVTRDVHANVLSIPRKKVVNN